MGSGDENERLRIQSDVSAVSSPPVPRGTPLSRGLGARRRGDEETTDTSDYYELRIFFQKILEILIDTRELDTAVY